MDSVNRLKALVTESRTHVGEWADRGWSEFLDELSAELAASRPGEPWQLIATAPKAVVSWQPVDLWMQVHASPMSFGMSDAFRVPDCWRNAEGKWVHDFRGKEAELNRDYITHWCALPAPPKDADQ